MLKNTRLKATLLMTVTVTLFFIVTSLSYAEKVVVIPLGTNSNISTSPSNVVTVAKDNGDYTNIMAAINSITNATESNSYIVKIMPGTYDVGTEMIVVKPYIDLIGSGANTTIITGHRSTAINEGIVKLSGGTTLSDISIVNTGNTGNGNEGGHYHSTAVVIDGVYGLDGLHSWTSAYRSVRRKNVTIRNANIVARNGWDDAVGLYISGSSTILVDSSVIETYQYVESGSNSHHNAIYIDDSIYVDLRNLTVKSSAGNNPIGIVITNGSKEIKMYSLNVYAEGSIYWHGILVDSGEKSIYLYSSFVRSGYTSVKVSNSSMITIAGSSLRHGATTSPVQIENGGAAICVGCTKVSYPYGDYTTSTISTTCQ